MEEQDINLLFERTKAYLMQTNEKGDSIYNLLSDALLYLMDHAGPSKSNIIDLDNVLTHIKDCRFRYNNAITTQPDEKLFAKQKLNPTILTSLYPPKAQKEEVKQQQQKVEEEEEEDSKLARNYLFSNIKGMTNILEDAYWFELGGIGFPKEEAYRISLSLAMLQKKKSLDRLRFFGKIFGSDKNYIIAESEYRPFPSELKIKLDQEQFTIQESDYNSKNFDNPGEGLNKFTYWVCVDSEINSEWIQLPDVTPEQIKKARLIKKIFTGNLTNRINSYPPFPGNECNYLRAQIARIVKSTLILPSIFSEFEVPEEEEEDKKKERVNFPICQLKPKEERERPMKEYLNLENWQDSSIILRKPKKDNEEEQEENEKQEEDKEEELKNVENWYEAKVILPGMKKIKKKKENTDDQEEEEEEEEANNEWKPLKQIPAWIVRQYNKLYSSEFSVVILKNMCWPGAYAYCSQKGMKFGNVYIGFGHKETFGAFTPMPLPEVMTEIKDLEEKKDPSARNEKRMLAGDEPLDEDKVQEEVTQEDEEEEEEED